MEVTYWLGLVLSLDNSVPAKVDSRSDMVRGRDGGRRRNESDYSRGLSIADQTPLSLLGYGRQLS